MRAYLIDPTARTVEPVNYSGDYADIYELIGAETFCAVQLNDERDTVFLDDEGLFREGQEFFALEGYAQPLAGRGLVLGCDAEGESDEPRITLDELRSRVQWLTGAQAVALNNLAVAAMEREAEIVNGDPNADHFIVMAAPRMSLGEDGKARAE